MRFPRVTVGRMMLAIAVVALVFSGIVLVFGPREVELRPHPHPARMNGDHDIFDIVLADLLEDEGFNHFAEGEKKQLILGTTSEQGVSMEVGDLPDLKKALEDKGIDLEILGDFHDRNPRGVRFDLTDYKPANPGIAVRDLETIGYDRSDKPPWVQTWLPAYSKDGKVALLRFWFGPSPHGSGGFYLLKKVEGRWAIIKKALFHFM